MQWGSANSLYLLSLKGPPSSRSGKTPPKGKGEINYLHRMRSRRRKPSCQKLESCTGLNSKQGAGDRRASEGWAHSRLSASIFRCDCRVGWEGILQAESFQRHSRRFLNATVLSAGTGGCKTTPSLSELQDAGTWCTDPTNSGADAVREKHRVSGPPAHEERGAWKPCPASTCLA